MEKTYDAIIAGASFAGLSVARELDGKVLLVDRKEPGTSQTSACGTLVSLAKEYGGAKSIIQKFDKVAFHGNGRTAIAEVSEPWCTIDYEKFCSAMLKKCDADFVKATAKGVKGNKVATDKGAFSAKCIVDCTGWSAALAGSLEKGFADRKTLALNMETVVPYGNDMLNFYYDREIMACGVGWVFPAGKVSRIGFGCYRSTNVMPALEKFLAKLGVEKRGVHGSFTPLRLRKPTVGNLFVVGDAAGQATPLTSEGIRPSLLLGKRCGQEIQRVIDGKATLEGAQAAYAAGVAKLSGPYGILARLQDELLRRQESAFGMLQGIVSNRALAAPLERAYLGIGK